MDKIRSVVEARVLNRIKKKQIHSSINGMKLRGKHKHKMATKQPDDVKDYVDNGHCDTLPLCLLAYLYHHCHNSHAYPLLASIFFT